MIEEIKKIIAENELIKMQMSELELKKDSLTKEFYVKSKDKIDKLKNKFKEANDIDEELAEARRDFVNIQDNIQKRTKSKDYTIQERTHNSFKQ